MPAPLLAAAAAAATIAATVTCEHAAGAGRVRCEAHVTASPAEAEIAWADLVVVRTASFLGPLRGRVAPADASDKKPGAWTFEFALVAKERGTGDLVVRARAVVCTSAACVPAEAEVTTSVDVGPSGAPR